MFFAASFAFSLLLSHVFEADGIPAVSSSDGGGGVSINIGTININMDSNGDFKLDKLSSQIMKV